MGLRHLFRNTSGTAAAEMALILPGIAFITLNLVDLSMYIYTKMQVDLAAHEAVGAARVLCNTAAQLPATINCGSTLSSTMTAAAQSTTLGSTVSIVPNSTVEKYYCANSSGVLMSVAVATATATTTPALPANCSATVTGSTSAPGIYIQTTASKAFSPVFPGASVAAFLTTPITRTAWLRLK